MGDFSSQSCHPASTANCLVIFQAVGTEIARYLFILCCFVAVKGHEVLQNRVACQLLIRL